MTETREDCNMDESHRERYDETAEDRKRLYTHSFPVAKDTRTCPGEAACPNPECRAGGCVREGVVSTDTREAQKLGFTPCERCSAPWDRDCDGHKLCSADAVDYWLAKNAALAAEVETLRAKANEVGAAADFFGAFTTPGAVTVPSSELQRLVKAAFDIRSLAGGAS